VSVPAVLAIPRVLEALRLRLLNDSALVGRLASAPAAVGGGPAIYTEGVVPADATTDYLTIGPFTERSDATMGDGAKWGSELTAAIKLVTYSRDVGHSLATIDRLVALLHGTTLPVTDYTAGWVLLSVIADAYSELQAGQVLMHYPTIWQIRVHQPS
jgi:hypothetical protein